MNMGEAFNSTIPFCSNSLSSTHTLRLYSIPI